MVAAAGEEGRMMVEPMCTNISLSLAQSSKVS